jgi:hypothetical protein
MKNFYLLLEKQGKLAILLGMENNNNDAANLKITNTIITGLIDWDVLVGLSGMCLLHYELINTTGLAENPEFLAKEIARQVCAQGMQQGIDPMGESGQGCITFSMPFWAVSFLAEILNRVKERSGTTQGDKLTEITLAVGLHPFGKKAMALLDGKDKKFGEDLPGYRLN